MHRIWYNKAMNFAQLEKYSENNRIEAKRATGGFPQSVWETYSAFANTLGGIILLGVKEGKDYSLHAVDLPDAEGLANEFWRLVNEKRTVSANILSREQVAVEEVDGKKIVVVTVPRASRREKPIYVGLSPLDGSYRRSGEGDYKCTPDEVQEMLKESRMQTPDMQLLAGLGVDALCKRSRRSYRKRVEAARPQHAWEEKTEEEFFALVGALGRDSEGSYRPTAAGVLALGKSSVIRRLFPTLTLEYWEEGQVLFTGKNLFDFYLSAGKRLTEGYPTAIKKALLEGLANSLINAAYCGEAAPVGKGGERAAGKIIAARKEEEIFLSNPGGFSIDIQRAKRGGVAEPRNEGVMRLFHLMGVGGGAGRGIPQIYEAWRAEGWASPAFIEGVSPARITLLLPLGQKGWEGKLTDEGLLRELAIGYLTDHATATKEELSALLGDCKVVERLVEENIVVQTDGNYKLKR